MPGVSTPPPARPPPSVTSTISGGTPRRNGMMLQPRPPETTTSQFIADVAIGELLPGRRDRRPAQQAHLAAMGMAGELQRNARRHAPRDIRLVRHQDDRRVVGDFRKRRAEIVDADALERPEAPRRHIGELIAEAGQPERVAVLGQPRRRRFRRPECRRLPARAGRSSAPALRAARSCLPTSRDCREPRARRAAPSIRQAPAPIRWRE